MFRSCCNDRTPAPDLELQMGNTNRPKAGDAMAPTAQMVLPHFSKPRKVSPQYASSAQLAAFMHSHQIPQGSISGSTVLREEIGGRAASLDIETDSLQMETLESVLASLRSCVTELEKLSQRNIQPPYADWDRKFAPVILAALNEQNPRAKLQILQQDDIEKFLNSSESGELTGIVDHDNHFSTISISKSEDAVRLLNIDSVKATKHRTEDRLAFRSKNMLEELAESHPSAQLAWTSSKSQSSVDDCLIFSFDNAQLLASRKDRDRIWTDIQETTSGNSSGIPLPELPSNVKVVVDGEDVLPANFSRHSQGKSHLEEKARYSEVTAAWGQNKVTRMHSYIDAETGLTVEKELIYNASIESRRIALYKLAIDHLSRQLMPYAAPAA